MHCVCCKDSLSYILAQFHGVCDGWHRKLVVTQTHTCKYKSRYHFSATEIFRSENSEQVTLTIDSSKMSDFFKDVVDGKVRDVRKWIERGENISQYDGYGNAAIHLATEKGYRGVCKVLIDAGADVNQRNLSVGWTAVHYAAYEGHTDLLRMLIAHGAIPDLQDSSGDTAETYAREWENNECITIIKEAVAIREQRSRQTR